MSLRREVHSAFDVITPPLGGMPERVVQTVLADKSRRRNKEMLFRLRAPLSLVAALVAIALVAAVLVGGRLIQDWNVFRSGSPAGHAQLTAVQQLEARAFHIPRPRALADCQSGPYNANGDFGSGPVYGVGGWVSSSDWGYYYHNYAYADTSISGPILVRAIDLFTNVPVIFIGPYATGAKSGSDTVDGAAVEQRSEAVLYTSSAIKNGVHRHLYEWDFTAGVPKSWSNATGWQIDGQNFSETFLGC